MNPRIKKSFTLIELLVVIAIIGSLSGLLVSNYMAARERARDAQRKNDLRQIQKALEMYRQDQNPPAYPTALPAVGNQWKNASGSVVYMNNFPGDPNRTPANYYYEWNNNNLTYTLCACLENKADPDATGTGDCSPSYSCGSDSQRKYYQVIQP
ncbi:MAG: type II secretion system GspH family protein [Patescibacteria group bacterium]|nr:type II secretion system GspH family protein [Patescibacteria group bacterium]